MSQSSSSTSHNSTPRPEAGELITTDTRVDAPHRSATPHFAAEPSSDASHGAADDVGPLLEVADEGPFAIDDVESMRNEARQLSILLRERQEALDRREAAWHVQLAHHEKEARSARVWLSNRREELAEQEANLAAREAEVEMRFCQLRDAEAAYSLLNADRDEQLVYRETALGGREANVAQQARELDEMLSQAAVEAAARRAESIELDRRREQLDVELDARRREVEAELNSVRERLATELQTAIVERRLLREDREEFERLSAEPSDYQVRLQAELDDQEQELLRREAITTETEQRVRLGLVDVERLQAEWRTEHERLAEQERRNRLEYAEQRRRLENETDETRRELARQNEQLDFRRAAVRQEQADLAESQRETLEMRIAVEELWTQLAGSVPSAQLSENLARVRNRLSEQYRLQQHEIATSRAELESLRADLAAEGEKLRIQTAELRRWAEARHEEIERQAAFLTAREAELERQDAEYRRTSTAWRQERGRLEQEVRRLENELRRSGSFASR